MACVGEAGTTSQRTDYRPRGPCRVVAGRVVGDLAKPEGRPRRRSEADRFRAVSTAAVDSTLLRGRNIVWFGDAAFTARARSDQGHHYRAEGAGTRVRAPSVLKGTCPREVVRSQGLPPEVAELVRVCFPEPVEAWAGRGKGRILPELDMSRVASSAPPRPAVSAQAATLPRQRKVRIRQPMRPGTADGGSAGARPQNSSYRRNVRRAGALVRPDPSRARSVIV
jgi:hypothetical protein